MATIEQPVVENLKDTPDLGALKAMENPVVLITKISPTGKRSGNRLVVNAATGLKWNEILAFHDTLPAGTIPNSGPGLYKFEVTDQGSTSKLSWQIRLGSEAVDVESVGEAPRLGFVAPAVPVAPAAPARPVPPAPDAQNLGNGWVYNPSLEMLTAPNGEMFTWRKGMPLPSMTVLPTTSTATPVSPTVYPQGSTAVSPELESMRQMLAATQAALTEAKERERETARQAEIRALQEQMAKALDENNRRFEALVAKLAERPERNSEVEELKRRLEEKDRLDSLRAEMKAQADSNAALLREATAHKGPDPMIGILTEMLKDQRHSSDENIRALRDQMMQERMASKDTNLTPEKLVGLLERWSSLTKNEASADMATKMLSGFDMLMDRMMKITQMERELGGGGGGIDWLSVIRELGGKAGSALQLYQQAKAQEAAAAAENARAETARAAATTAVAQARTAMAKQGGTVPLPARPVGAAQPGAPAGAPAGTPAGAPGAPPPPIKPKRRVQVVPPRLEDATLPELRALFKPEADELFFGPFFEYVENLREQVAATPSGLSADEIASFVLEAREFIAVEAKKSGTAPHAAELMAAGQYTYLLERVLPAASEGLRSEILKSIKAKLLEEESAARIAANNATPGRGDAVS